MVGTELRAFPLFANLSEADAQRLAEGMQSRSFPARQRLFDAGEPARGFYLIKQGQVKIFRVSPEGNEQVLGVFGAGQTFAEAAVFLGGGYPASAETLETSQLLFLERETLLRIVRNDPDFALRLLGGLSMKLRHMVRLIDSLTLKDARGRVARYLAGLLPPDGAGPVTVDLPISKTLLARLLGVTGETLSRTLKGLTTEGIISSSDRGAVVVEDPRALLDAAGVEGTRPPTPL